VRKFSASRFWSECIKRNVTASQYLGEIIRYTLNLVYAKLRKQFSICPLTILIQQFSSYLYNQPEKPEDKLHKVHTFFGNGVNPAIWEKFVQRFNNVKIKEIYGATEGNCNTSTLSHKTVFCIPTKSM